MNELLTGIVVGLGVAVVGYVVFRLAVTRAAQQPEMRVIATIEQIRSVGELVVFKVVTKEIVHTVDHWLGDVGKKYLSWLISSKKLAMIFKFEIDFRYDLRSGEFVIEDQGDATYRLKMPPCYYETHIKSVSFYDEKRAELLPLLLPDLINQLLDRGFDEAAKNRLVEEAKATAMSMAKDFVRNMRSEVQTSARQTLSVLAKGFGAEHVTVDFSEAELVEGAVSSPAFAAEVAAAEDGKKAEGL